MATPEDIRRYRRNLQDEIDGAAIYRAMAAAEEPPLADVYLRLAQVEERHAGFWRERLEEAGAGSVATTPSWRARVLVWLARRFGAALVAPIVAADESRSQTMYDDQPEASATAMPADERSHARVLRTIVGQGGEGAPGGVLARLEGRHRTIGGNALRAAVLGANDGLVSNLSLVMGVAGAALSESTIAITGFAGLLAGAISMALGEWISVQSARESAERQLEVEAEEIAAIPDEEREELALIYEAKGLPREEAVAVADRIFQDREAALDVMAREELGIDPEDLGGSPWEAAISSFLLFAVGAVIPVLPFLFLEDLTAVAASVVASGVGLFVLGVGISLLTGRGAWFSGTRQVLFGLAAAAVTYGIGSLIGVGLA